MAPSDWNVQSEGVISLYDICSPILDRLSF